MLSLILNKKNQNNTNFQDLDRIKSSKHFPSSNREWKSSIYAYNKNNLNLIPVTDSYALNIIKIYFSLFNRNIERKLRTKRLRFRSRKFTTNKVYISNGEFKHTNDKVIINIYMFNRQINNYRYLTKTIKSKLRRYIEVSKDLFFKKAKILKKKALSSLFLNQIKMLKSKNLRTRNYITINMDRFCKRIINRQRKKRLLYWYYKQIKFINKSKFTYIYLQYLKQQLSVIYNKRVEFNFINLKRFYLNSDIVSEFLTKKIRFKRKKASAYLNKVKNKIIVKRIKHLLVNNKVNKLGKKINLTNTKLSRSIINNLKYRSVTGFRVEARGRLTKRYTASRTVLRMEYKGNLLNIDSSIKGLSSVLLKGNLRSNIQYTQLAYKSRIGSFGIRGWISGY